MPMVTIINLSLLLAAFAAWYRIVFPPAPILSLSCALFGLSCCPNMALVLVSLCPNATVLYRFNATYIL